MIEIEAGRGLALSIIASRARRTADAKPSQQLAMPNGRCRMHGQGPRTPQGLERSRCGSI